MKSNESEGYEGCEASFPGIGNQAVDRYEVILVMSVQRALEIWRYEGAPVIYLGPGENCQDLEKLLARPDVSNRHLAAIGEWLKKRGSK